MKEDVLKLKKEGLSVREIADKLDIDRNKVFRILKKSSETDEKSETVERKSETVNETAKEDTSKSKICKYYEKRIINEGVGKISYCKKSDHSLGGKFSDCNGDVDSCPFSYKL